MTALPLRILATGLRLDGLAMDLWVRRWRTRRRLRDLSPHLLADVGLTEADRRQECAKWFWQG